MSYAIDYLTFTYRPEFAQRVQPSGSQEFVHNSQTVAGDGPRAGMLHALRVAKAIQPDIEPDWSTWGDKGHHGFTFSGRLTRHGQTVGFVAAGGGGHGRVFVELTGAALAGCSLDSWPEVADWLENDIHARLSRVDCCYDDMDGSRSVHDVRKGYLAGDFDRRGQRPSHEMRGPWDCPEKWGEGLTYYIGKRQNGVMLRAYEKGRQLGDESSPWVRFEVEFRRTSKKEISFDVLREPVSAMAGTYQWLQWLPSACDASPAHIHQAASAIALSSLMRYARVSYGKLFCFLQSVKGWDAGEVVARLTTPGQPRRLNPALLY